MSSDHPPPTDRATCRRFVQRVLLGGIPEGKEFEACRAVLRSGTLGGEEFHALCVLMEGALADPALDIDETQIVVPLLKELAHGTIGVEDLL